VFEKSGEPLGRCHGSATTGDGPGAANLATLPFAQATPDAELLTVGKGIFEAVITHDAAPAHFLRLASGRAAFGKEQLGVDPHAVRFALPCSDFSVELCESTLHGSPAFFVVQYRFGAHATEAAEAL
jgi:hypothetical protein